MNPLNKTLLCLAASLILGACGASREDEAPAQAAPAAASASRAASDGWITDNGEQTHALPEPASSEPLAVPVKPEPETAPSSQASALAGGKLADACEALVNRMGRCYDRLPAESAGEMKATLSEVRASLIGTEDQVCKTTMAEEFNATAAVLGCE